jgi:hypothetical protein
LPKWRGHLVRFAKLQPFIATLILHKWVDALTRVKFRSRPWVERDQQQHLKRLDNLASFCQTFMPTGLHSYHHYARIEGSNGKFSSRRRPLLVAVHES